VFNPADIDWPAYKKWSASVDGIARVSMRSTYGVGYIDPHFEQYRQGALQAGIDVIIYYHYGYPQFNGASAEADYQHSVVGAIRAQDVLMLDYEEGASQANAAWAYAWLARQEQNYGGKLPTIYASDAYIRQRLQDARLARYPLTLANWQYSPDERPACPPPWTSYTYLQYTDRAINVPGIAGTIDADIYLGQEEIVLPLTIEMPEVAALFEEVDAQHWRSKKTQKILQDGLLADYQANGLYSLKYLGNPISNEVSLVKQNGAMQFYDGGARFWSRATGKVSSLPLYDDGPGTDPRLVQARQQIAQLEAQHGDPKAVPLLHQIAQLVQGY